MKHTYEEKRKLLQNTYIENLKKGKSVKFVKKTSNLFRKQKQNNLNKINISDFDEVIYIDKKNKTAVVEGMISFEKLVKETLKYDLLPTVVPQLKTITLGGAISGIGIEASSFRYGLVHETVQEMEIMLADGNIIKSTPDNDNKDLFFALPNSYGTLGYVLKVKIRLISAKKFVKLNYFKYSDKKKYFHDLRSLCQSAKYDYIDGVIFSDNLMYIVGANFTDKAPYVSNYKYMNIYYKSILKNKIDYMTTRDFIWRWDTDWFWCSKIFYMQNKFLRFILGKFMLGSKSYWKIARFDEKYKLQEKISKMLGTYQKSESVVQDVVIPIENCEKFLNFFNKNIGILPIWICPTKTYDDKHDFPFFSLDKHKLYVDFGFWDVVPSNKPDGYLNKMIEVEVEKLHGNKSLYSTSFYTKDKFWKLYNGVIYAKIKNKYDPSKIKKDLFERCVLNK